MLFGVIKNVFDWLYSQLTNHLLELLLDFLSGIIYVFLEKKTGDFNGLSEDRIPLQLQRWLLSVILSFNVNFAHY